MTILVVGRQGQLAQCLQASGREDLVFSGRPETDLRDPASLQRVLAETQPHAVINAAAYTNVDKAETDQGECYAINHEGPAALASLCAAHGIPLLHVSTDCVFDGRQTQPYEPGDTPNPISVYGHSKLAGELAVREANSRHLIVRVSWVFSGFAGNFVRTMLSLAMTKHEVAVVDDQFGYPTYGPDLASALLTMIDAAALPGFSAWGTYHFAGSTDVDRASLAEAVFAESRSLGGPTALVRRVPTQEYPTPAKRPLNARLSSASAEETFGVVRSDWRTGLRRCVPGLLHRLRVDEVS